MLSETFFEDDCQWVNRVVCDPTGIGSCMQGCVTRRPALQTISLCISSLIFTGLGLLISTHWRRTHKILHTTIKARKWPRRSVYKWINHIYAKINISAIRKLPWLKIQKWKYLTLARSKAPYLDDHKRQARLEMPRFEVHHSRGVWRWSCGITDLYLKSVRFKAVREQKMDIF